MNRFNVIQSCIDALGGRVYLEIGIKRGETFFKVRARRKIAVDPHPVLSRRHMLASVLHDWRNVLNSYFRMESDLFFAKQSHILTSHSPDVVFIDGLHTYEQSLRDVQNSLRFLAPDGIIVLHDCNPTSETSALPLTELARRDPGSVPGWSGDVWKTIVHLRTTEPDLEVVVLDCDCGVGIIRRGKAGHTLNYTTEEIPCFRYSQLEKNRRKLLNLQSPSCLEPLLKRHFETIAA